MVVGVHRAESPAMDNQRYSILASKGCSCNVAIKSRVEPSLLVLYRDVATKSQRLNARHKKQQRAVLVKTLFNRQNVVVGVHRAESPAMAINVTLFWRQKVVVATLGTKNNEGLYWCVLPFVVYLG